MNNCMIACETLRDELLFTMETAGVTMPVIWIASGLHNTPNKLHDRLQEALDSIKEYAHVYLLFGFCGNAVRELKTGAFELIIPRVDDCISLLIGSPQKRVEIGKEYAAYFMTEGWLRGERNIWVEYKHCLEKYGQEQTAEIITAMYGHYRSLGLLDAGVSPIGPLVSATAMIAEKFGLVQKVIPATTSYIQALLLGPWPAAYFIVKGPHSEITAVDLLLE